MNFSTLSDCHKKWQDILVIGKTVEQDGRKYHILGMTLSDEAKLYIIEPYAKREPINRKGIRNNRRILKQQEGRSCCYLHCSDFCLGDEKLPDYSPDMPITITHSPDFTQHILEKTVTLNVGKSR